MTQNHLDFLSEDEIYQLSRHQGIISHKLPQALAKALGSGAAVEYGWDLGLLTDSSLTLVPQYKRCSESVYTGPLKLQRGFVRLGSSVSDQLHLQPMGMTALPAQAT